MLFLPFTPRPGLCTIDRSGPSRNAKRRDARRPTAFLRSTASALFTFDRDLKRISPRFERGDCGRKLDQPRCLERFDFVELVAPMLQSLFALYLAPSTVGKLAWRDWHAEEFVFGVQRLGAKDRVATLKRGAFAGD